MGTRYADADDLASTPPKAKYTHLESAAMYAAVSRDVTLRGEPAEAVTLTTYVDVAGGVT